MEKYIKIGLAVSAGLCIAGTVFTGIGTLISEKQQAVQAQKQAKMAASMVSLPQTKLDAYQSMQVKLNILDLTVRPSNDDSFYISYTTFDSSPEETPLQYQVKDGVLTLTENDAYTSARPHILDLLTDDGDVEDEIILYVPAQTELQDSNLSSDCSDVDFKNVSLRQATIQTNTGDFDFIFCQLKDLTCTSDEGDFDMENSTLDTCAFRLSSGDWSGENNTYSGQNTIISDAGDISVEDPAQHLLSLTIQADTKAGDMDIYPPLGAHSDAQSFHHEGSADGGTLTIQTDSGDISMECD